MGNSNLPCQQPFHSTINFESISSPRRTQGTLCIIGRESHFHDSKHHLIARVHWAFGMVPAAAASAELAASAKVADAADGSHWRLNRLLRGKRGPGGSWRKNRNLWRERW